MPEQFKKIDNQELELSKINPTKVNIPKPIELTPSQDENLLGLANKAKQAEEQGDLKKAIEFYQEYKDEYLNFKEEKERIHLREKGDDQEFQKKAIDYIQTLLSQGADKDSVAIGLAGLDSDKAWEMRETLLSQGVDKDYIAIGLAGIDSDKAWEMRETFLSQGADKNRVALGLAGLDSEKAWEMRETLLSQGVDKGWVARGIYGDYLMEGIRKARRDRAKKE